MTPVIPANAQFEVMVERHFSAAHHLLNYEGKCENPHGHNFVVRIWAAGNRLDAANVCIDYKILKRELDKLMDRLDHTDLNENPAIGGESPSSEFLAFWLYQELKPSIPQLVRTCVFETPTACAFYSEN